MTDFDGDPLRPDLENVTPVEIVATLTRHDRRLRNRALVAQAHQIYDLGVAAHRRGREVTASCLLFSGGNDSTTLAHLFKGRATHAIHANTTIGIEETRQYVRDTCATWGLPLVEETGDDSFEDLVLGRVWTKNGKKLIWPGGFPGPGAHALVYQRLKERALDKARHALGFANARNRCAVFIAGRRRDESENRADIPLHEPDGTVIWVSPIALWTKLDLNTYRLEHANSADPVPHNPVTRKIHMSGECLCGAYAHPGELEELRYWFPDVAGEIDDLAARVQADASTMARIDLRYGVWGHGIRGGTKLPKAGRLCSSCAPPPTGVSA